MHHTKRKGKDKAKDLTKSHHVDARKKKIEETSDCRQSSSHACAHALEKAASKAQTKLVQDICAHALAEATIKGLLRAL